MNVKQPPGEKISVDQLKAGENVYAFDNCDGWTLITVLSVTKNNEGRYDLRFALYDDVDQIWPNEVDNDNIYIRTNDTVQAEGYTCHES